jgi:hypothetical protein
MLFSCWSVKGGSGTTVVSVALAAVLGRGLPGGAVVVDLSGDVPAVLGIDDLEGPGVVDWLAAGDAVAPDGWSRLEQRVGDHLAVVRRGRGPLGSGDRAGVLAGLLAAGGRPIVVDCGVLPYGDDATDDPVYAFVTQATYSWLVVRPCYLTLRRCRSLPLRPSGVVVRRGSARDDYRTVDIERAVGAPVVADVPFEVAVARAVDDGLLGAAVPRGLARALRAAS